MGTITIKINNGTKDILDRYDAEQLLNTIPRDYSIPETSIKLYTNKYKAVSELEIKLSPSTQNRLKTLATTCNTQISLHVLFNFLIENVCDCGKIQTKKVAHALNNYYHVVVGSLNNEHCKSLFTKILNAYADSPFYKREIGLSEEDIANFLTISQERSSTSSRNR